MTMYPVSTYKAFPQIRGRMAEMGILQADLAVQLDIHPTLLNAILRARRPAPPNFEARIHAALDALEEEKRVAAEAVAKLRAERAAQDADGERL